MKNRIQMDVKRLGQMTSLLIFTSMILMGAIVMPIAAQDTLRPEIYGWGIDGVVTDGAPFTVWVNVTDTDSGVQNVSVHVRQDSGAAEVTLLTFNSTFYTTTFSGLELNHTYSIWVQSYDVAGNVAVSYPRNFDMVIILNQRPDPSVTFPYVMAVSLLTLGIAIGLSFVYDKRHPREDILDEEEEVLDE